MSLCIIRRLNSSREKGRLFVRIRKADSPMSPVPKRLRTSTIFGTRRPYLEGDKAVVGLADLGGARTLLIVPLLKQSKLIGTISIYRQEVRPFTDKQIEVVKNFAAQAVIAIENARLLSELRDESLQQQTATADVLKVISRSPGELEPVFQAMLKNAVQICGATFGMMFRYDDASWRAAAMFGVPPAFAEFWHRGPQRPSARTALGRIAQTRQTVHIADVTKEPAYIEGEPIFVAAVNLGKFRTILNVPMLKDSELIGALAIYHKEVTPFTDKQIDLLTSFASQAVIAIENTRLLSELRESLQQQTATADVLKVISRSTFDLKSVLGTLTEIRFPALSGRERRDFRERRRSLSTRRALRDVSRRRSPSKTLYTGAAVATRSRQSRWARRDERPRGQHS